MIVCLGLCVGKMTEQLCVEFGKKIEQRHIKEPTPKYTQQQNIISGGKVPDIPVHLLHFVQPI